MQKILEFESLQSINVINGENIISLASRMRFQFGPQKFLRGTLKQLLS